jgi:hypothetical protein
MEQELHVSIYSVLFVIWHATSQNGRPSVINDCTDFCAISIPPFIFACRDGSVTQQKTWDRINTLMLILQDVRSPSVPHQACFWPYEGQIRSSQYQDKASDSLA